VDSGAGPIRKSAVGYQLYARSFCDTTGDGVGDLEGIRRHLDHVAWLSVDDFASGRRTLRSSSTNPATAPLWYAFDKRCVPSV